MENTGIQYITTGDTRRGQMNPYHFSARMGHRDLSTGAKSTDIAQLRSAQRSNLTTMDCGDFKSKFTIGFEVEKSSLSRGATREYPLFSGFERDSSCGYEAVTNILPLLPASTWRNKVYSMMHDASRIIEDRYSPSNSRCGGHMTFAVEGMTGEELNTAIRPFAGIVLALFRKRLKNSYCSGNVMMTEGYGRYQMCLVKDNVVEFRLPSRIQSVKQMMRRYELMYELLNQAVNNPNGSPAKFLQKVKPIVKSMYAGEELKTNAIMHIATGFNKMLKTGKVNRTILNYVDPMRRMDADEMYDADLRRNGHESCETHRV
jgi:hypothetical protein